MKTTPESAQGFTDTLPHTHGKLKKSRVTQENDAMADGKDDQTPPLHRKEDSTQGDEGVDDPEP